MRRLIASLTGLFVIGASSAAVAQTVGPPSDAPSIAVVMIQQNVPPKPLFDAFLARDLGDYFVERGVFVRFLRTSLLRDTPTQVGVAFPKFYVWVDAVSLGGEDLSGAARLAAVKGEKFVVTDFLERSTILAEPEKVGRVFPRLLAPLILERAAEVP
jgi:hypothetical protein